MPEASFRWSTSPVQTFPNGFRIWSIRKRAQIHSTLLGLLPAMHQWIWENAPWEDVTGDARFEFVVEIDRTTLTNTVTFRHGDDIYYGQYLELHNEARFSVIDPALDYWGPKIFAIIQALM